MNPSDHLLNLKKAQEFIDSIEDRADRILLETARHKVMQKLTTLDGKPPMYPESPLDMFFYLVVVNDLVKHKEFLKELLDGKTDTADQMKEEFNGTTK